MEEKVKKSHRKIFKGEIVWYCIFGFLWITGLVFAILGICAFNVGKLSTNPLYELQKSFAAFFKMQGVMDFRIVGTVAMIIAMIGILIVVFSYTAKAAELEAKQRRREERMKILMESEDK
jgi:hypothetical protein